MRVLVCGSRTLTDAYRVCQRLDRLPEDATIIHGNARGADRLADFWARSRGRGFERFPADWKRHGKRAGIVRNLQMLDEQPDLVLAFWDGSSRGTKHTIDEAHRRGIPVEVVSA